jgi:hypothetical protein
LLRNYEVALTCKCDFQKYEGKYDNLLYYYMYSNWLIQKIYTIGDKSYRDFGRISHYNHAVQNEIMVDSNLERLK